MLESLGWDDHVRALYLSLPELPADAAPGRVVRIDRDRALVATPTGEVHVPLHGGITVGDWLAVRPEPAQPSVLSVVPRWSYLARTDPGSEGRRVDREHVLAANVDLVGVVEPLDRPVRARRLDRELALAWDGGALPVVLLSKADLHPDPLAAVDEVAAALVGVTVVAVSAASGLGIETVRALIRRQRTMVLLGPSGAGKSSITNALLGADALEVGDVRERDKRGRHTTTARHLLAVPGGGVLIDTPGLRSLGIGDAEAGLAMAFADIDELAAGCRFNDCHHDGEPGCAIAAAVEDGSLDNQRVDRWRHLAREVAEAESRRDPRAQAARRAEMKRLSRAIRADPRSRQKR